LTQIGSYALPAADVRRDATHRKALFNWDLHDGYDSNRRRPSCARLFPASIVLAVAMVWWFRVDVDALTGSR
jgi:hypothetical protein